MKKIYLGISIILGMITSALFSQCSESPEGFLDASNIELNEQIVFSDSIYTFEYVTKLYSTLPYTFFADNGGWYGGGYWKFGDMADEGKNKWSGTNQTAHIYNMGNLSASSNSGRISPHWTHPYESIYRATILLQKVDDAPLSEQRKKHFKGEARMLRAWYYFHLLRMFGGVPVLGEKVYGPTDPVEEGRSKFEDVVQFIIDELDKSLSDLPDEQRGSDYGRMTRGAALAIKSRVLLFAASPLFNGGGITNDPVLSPLLGYESYNKERWKKAADAAKAVIDLNRYSLVEDNETAPGWGFYRATTTRINTEEIFKILISNNRTTENLLLPATRGGQMYSSTWQCVVDAFPMANGKRITDSGSGYDPAKMYENRDPRFYYTLLYDGATWIPRTGSVIKERVNFFLGAPTDGVTGSNGTKTGYGWRKFCNENVTGAAGGNDAGHCIIRYAEILLNYAEALNEYSGPSSEVYNAVEAIRKRAGLDPYQLPQNLTQDEMRNYIREERRVELAFEEGIRYFDLKRWQKLKEVKDGVEFQGIKWTDPASGPQTYELFTIETHTFPDRQYFYPIPISEINTVGVEKLPQNPGW